MMYFASDNGGAVHPQIMEALARANKGFTMPYGAEAAMEAVRAALRETFEAPAAAVYLLSSGTAANALILATLAKPFEAIFCTGEAHIFGDECFAPEFYTGGAKLSPVASHAGKMQPAALADALGPEGLRDVHEGALGALSLTNLSEAGTLYTPAEISALTALAGARNLPSHLDGARLANALVASGASPAEMTWKAGIDAVSFGATKNGAMALEAVIFFDPDLGREFELRRMRGGHLLSKHRYLSAQMLAYLHDDLWLDLARAANAANARLAEGLRAIDGVEILHAPEGNITFMRASRARHQRLFDAGAQYYVMDGPLTSGDPAEMLTARLVCGWSTPQSSITQFLETLSV